MIKTLVTVASAEQLYCRSSGVKGRLRDRYAATPLTPSFRGSELHLSEASTITSPNKFIPSNEKSSIGQKTLNLIP